MTSREVRDVLYPSRTDSQVTPLGSPVSLEEVREALELMADALAAPSVRSPRE